MVYQRMSPEERRKEEETRFRITTPPPTTQMTLARDQVRQAGMREVLRRKGMEIIEFSELFFTGARQSRMWEIGNQTKPKSSLAIPSKVDPDKPYQCLSTRVPCARPVSGPE